MEIPDKRIAGMYCRVKGMKIMAERISRAVRMGIDVGGTYTKCVAMDNETHEIIGKIRLRLHMMTRVALLPVL